MKKSIILFSLAAFLVISITAQTPENSKVEGAKIEKKVCCDKSKNASNCKDKTVVEKAACKDKATVKNQCCKDKVASKKPCCKTM